MKKRIAIPITRFNQMHFARDFEKLNEVKTGEKKTCHLPKGDICSHNEVKEYCADCILYH